jgi:ArsR family transcriptional regulator
VVDRRAGLWVYYRLNPEMADWIRNILHETYQGMSTQSPYVDDVKALQEMPDRPDAPRCA